MMRRKATIKEPPAELEEMRRRIAELEDSLRRCQRELQVIDCFFAFFPELLCDLGFDGYAKKLNPTWEKTLGFTTQELQAKPLMEFVHPEDREQTAAQLEKGFTEAAPISFECRCRGKDGSYRWLLWYAVPIVEARLLYTVASDVTDRKRTEEALRKSEEMYRTLVEAIDDSINVTDAEGRYLVVNTEFVRRTGSEKEDIIGKTALEVWPPGIGSRVHELHQHVLKTGVVTENELEFPRERAAYTLVRRVPVRDDAGRVVGVVTVSRDITERKRMEEQLHRAQRLETAGRIAAQVSHDFNNLLTPMVAYPELIKMQIPEGHPATTFCDAMLEAAQQMADINGDMMALGRRGHVEQHHLDLNRVVEQSVGKLVDRPDTLAVELDLSPDLLPVSGSEAQLLRVVTNLIFNAQDATQGIGLLQIKTEDVYVDQPLGRYNQVEVGEYVKLRVADTGCGIPPEIRDRVFDAFFTTKRRGKRPGSGLGLSIVQAIVEDHRGFIDLESEVGRGTTFSVYLPACRDAARETPSKELRGGTEAVLVVDDDRLQREAAMRLLQPLGYRVDAVASGEEAVAYLRERQADILILDMIMPGGMDGAETYRRVLEVRPGQRAIIVSGFAETEQVRDVQALGAGPYLRKPVTLEKLAQGVRQELDRR